MEPEDLGVQDRRRLYEQMVLIRKFEEKLVQLAREQGRLPGMQILAIGQEAVAVGVAAALLPEDVVISNHRSHGHLLARNADPDTLMAEIMGKATGVGRGKAGTLHLSVPEVNVLMTSTVVGAGPPLAAGAAFAQQYRAQPHVTVVFYGDGAAAEGSVHEAMNLAALWRLPLLFVCENNAWAGAQSVRQHSPVRDLWLRAAGYGMPGVRVDGNNVEQVCQLAAKLLQRCRRGEGPALLETETYRMRGHGESDHQHYVDPHELEFWAARCPIKSYRDHLLASSVLSEEVLRQIETQAERRVDAALRYADDSPYPAPEEALADVWVDEDVLIKPTD